MPKVNEKLQKPAVPSDRCLDGIVYQIFYKPVLQTGRGPFSDGIPVPHFSTSIDAGLMLRDHVLPRWKFAMRECDEDVFVSLSAPTGDRKLEYVCSRELDNTAAVLLAVTLAICKEIELENGFEPDTASTALDALIARSTDDSHSFMTPMTLKEALMPLNEPQEAAGEPCAAG